MSTQYGQLIGLGQDKKLIAAAEVGSAPLPDLLQAYEADWLWFTVWGDSYINNPEYNPVDTLKKVSGLIGWCYDSYADYFNRFIMTTTFSHWMKSRGGKAKVKEI